jgi:perosamine synthetase
MTTTFPSHTLQLPSDQEASGRTLGEEELALLREVILSGTLTSTKGRFVKQLETQFAAKLGLKSAYACASGTAAIHVAIAAINPEPGDEVVTTTITDMGALTPILYQAAIPVFAEVDPDTCNITARTIEPCLSDRTRAIIVTHLFGCPCEMGEIMELAESKNIPVIEDCAQAFLAQYQNQFVGTIGRIGCFSLQQGKHITTGEGGLVVTNDEALGRRMYHFINKAWGYDDPHPDHYFLALNYRMSELQGAVAAAQLQKLESNVQNRILAAQRLTAKLAGVPGIKTPRVSPGTVHCYWKYCLRVDGRVIPGGAVGLAAKLKDRQISCTPRYIQKPAFMCQIFKEQNTFGNSHYPFTLARPEVLNYSPERFPLTFEALEQILVLPFNERYRQEHIDYIAGSIIAAVSDKDTLHTCERN